MTIRQFVDVASLNSRFSHFERCTDDAPPQAYAAAKTVRAAIGDAVDAMIHDFRALGLKVDNCDASREIEVLIYGWLCESNRNSGMFTEAEAFGRALDGDDRDRVLASCRADVAFMAKMQVTPYRDSVTPYRDSVAQRGDL